MVVSFVEFLSRRAGFASYSSLWSFVSGSRSVSAVGPSLSFPCGDVVVSGLSFWSRSALFLDLCVDWFSQPRSYAWSLRGLRFLSSSFVTAFFRR